MPSPITRQQPADPSKKAPGARARFAFIQAHYPLTTSSFKPSWESIWQRAGEGLTTATSKRRRSKLNQALALISHLQEDPDFKAGGEVARVMDCFYSVARTQILEAGARLSPEILQRVIAQLASQREAWEKVERANCTATVMSNRVSPDPSGREASNPQPSARWSA